MPDKLSGWEGLDGSMISFIIKNTYSLLLNIDNCCLNCKNWVEMMITNAHFCCHNRFVPIARLLNMASGCICNHVEEVWFLPVILSWI